MEPQTTNSEKRPKTPPEMTIQEKIKLMNYGSRSRSKSRSSKNSFKQPKYYDNLHNSPQPKQKDNSTIKRQIVSQMVLPAPIYSEQKKQQKIFNSSIIRINENSNSTIKVDQSQLLDQTVNEQTSNKSDMLVKKQEKQIQKVEEKLEIQRIDQSRNQGFLLPLESRMIDRDRRQYNGNETERMMIGQGQNFIQNPFTENNSQDKNKQFFQEPKYFFSPFLKNNTLRQQQATYQDKIKQNESLLLSPFEFSPIQISPRNFAQQKRKSDQQEDILFFSHSPYAREEQKEPSSPFNSQERSQNKGRKNGHFRKLSPKPQKLIAKFQCTQEKIQQFQQKPQKKQQFKQQKQILLDQNENKNRNNQKFQQDRLTFIPPLPLKSSNQPTKNITSIRIKRSKSERNQNHRQIDYFKENILGYIQNKQHILQTKIIKKQKGKQSSISKKSNHSNSTVKKSQSQKSIQQNDPNKTHRMHEMQGIACQCNGNLQERKEHRIKRTQLENKRKAEQKQYEKNYDKKWKKTKPSQIEKQFQSKCSSKKSSRKSSMRQRSQQMNKSKKSQVNEILRQMNYSHRQIQIVNNQDQQIEAIFDSTQFDIAWKRKKMQEIYQQMLDLDSGPGVEQQMFQKVRSLIIKQLRRQKRQPKTIQQFKKAFPIRKLNLPHDQEDLLKQWKNDLIGYMEDLENYQNVLKQVLQNLLSQQQQQQESLRNENQENSKEEEQRQEQEEGQRQEQRDEREQQQVDERSMTVEEKFQQLKKMQQQLEKKYQQLKERQAKVEERQIKVEERSEQIQNYLNNQNQRFGKLQETFKQQTQYYLNLFNQKQKQLQTKQKQMQEKQKQLQEKQKQLQEKMKYINLRQIKINNEQILVNSKLVLLQAKEQKLNFIQIQQKASRQSKRQRIISQKQLHKKNIQNQNQNENLSQISENENQSNSSNEQNSNQNNFNQENNIYNDENQIQRQRKTQKKDSQRRIRKQQYEKSTKRKNQRKVSQQKVEEETIRRNNNNQTKRKLKFQTQYNISHGQINDQRVIDQGQGNQQEENYNSQNDLQNDLQDDPQNDHQNNSHRIDQNAMNQTQQPLPSPSANRQVQSQILITKEQLEQYVKKTIEITLQRTILNNKNKLKFKDVKFILRSLTEQQKEEQNRNPMNEIKRYLQCQQCQQQENQLYQQIQKANNIIMEQRSLLKKLQQQNQELQKQMINLKQSYQQQRRRHFKPQPQQDYCEILLDNVLGMDELQSILLQGSNNDVQSIAKFLEYRMILITSYMTLCFEYYDESKRQQKVKRLKEKDEEIKGRFQWLSGNSQRVFDKEMDRFFMTFEGRRIE